MNKHVMAIAVCLALQPVVSLSAETMTQSEVKERGSRQSFEIQRGRGVPTKTDQSGSGNDQGNVANGCITFRERNPNGVASQEANKPGSVRNDCDPMQDGSRLAHTFPDGARLYAVTNKNGIQKLSAIDQRGRALKVEIVRNPPKDLLLGPNDAVERSKQRAAEGRGRRQAALGDIDDAARAKNCIVKIIRPNNSLNGPNNSLYWDLAGSGLGCPKGA